MVSNYALDVKRKIFCIECYWSDSWNPSQYSLNYSFNPSFFDQLRDLFEHVPRPNLVIRQGNIASDYANYTGESKNVYLSFSIVQSEDIYYSTNIIDRSTKCFDCMDIVAGTELYGNIDCTKSFNSIFLIECRECLNSSFLFDCVNCSDCFLSSNLRNKRFVFKNKQLSEIDYQKAVREVDIGSFTNLQTLLADFSFLLKTLLHKYADITHSSNTTGNHIFNSKNTLSSFDTHDNENVKYGNRCPFVKDSMDIAWFREGELIYEYTNVGKTGHSVIFGENNWAENKNIIYCSQIKSCSDLFACIGLRNKQYCILNKQYTKEEYEELVPRIIAHMNDMPYVDSKGRVYRYGEFFPPELSPFAYNETIAQEYFPLTKEEALSKGYKWKDPESRDYKITKEPEDLPDYIKDVPDSILKEVIGCEHQGKCNEQCTTAFKIIEPELQFYRRMNLPLPRLCPNCRHYQRLKQRNPLKLWHRQCMCDYKNYQNTTKHPHHSKGQCPNEFETSYAPDRLEIVYCEQCYNAEVV